MLRSPLIRFNPRVINLQFQRHVRGGRREIDPEPIDTTQRPSTSNFEKGKSNAENLLKDAVTGYLKIEMAEHQDPWSSAPYPLEVLKKPKKDDAPTPPTIRPEEASIFLFPGQGAQYVGMADGLIDYPDVADMFHRASNILGYDLLKLCMEGPEEELNRTIHCQPAIFVTSLACVQKVQEKQPVAVRSCVAAAGFSVGEIAALVFADAFSFEEGVRLIKVRAEAMQRASEKEPSGLMSVFVRPDSRLKEAMTAAIAHMRSKGHPQPVCQIANYLFTQVKVIGGHDMALRFIEENAAEYNLRCKRVPVSGAFHTPLMADAVEELKEELKSMKIMKPLIQVHSNIDGHIYKSPEMIRRYLAKQIVSPVYWEQFMHIAYARHQGEAFPETYEMGPGQQLGIMLKKTNAKAAEFYTSYDVKKSREIN